MLTKREIANQEKATYEEMQRAQTVAHRDGEGQGHRGHAGCSSRPRRSTWRSSRTAPSARQAEAQGEAAYVELTGRAEATRVEAIGLANAAATEALGVARATGFEAQKEALGETATALVAVANAVSEGHITVVPEVLVTGGGGSFEGLAATLMRTFGSGNGKGNGEAKSLGVPQPQATVGCADARGRDREHRARGRGRDRRRAGAAGAVAERAGTRSRRGTCGRGARTVGAAVGARGRARAAARVPARRRAVRARPVRTGRRARRSSSSRTRRVWPSCVPSPSPSPCRAKGSERPWSTRCSLVLAERGVHTRARRYRELGRASARVLPTVRVPSHARRT